MDKNMISIDDLVRQRLGGEEEKERAGAWLQMRDLLDEEMPQKSAGIYWRRAMSALTLLLLITTASIGSYKLYTRAAGSGGEGVATLPATPSSAINNAVEGSNRSSVFINSNNSNNKNVATDLVKSSSTTSTAKNDNITASNVTKATNEQSSGKIKASGKQTTPLAGNTPVNKEDKNTLHKTNDNATAIVTTAFAGNTPRKSHIAEKRNAAVNNKVNNKNKNKDGNDAPVVNNDNTTSKNTTGNNARITSSKKSGENNKSYKNTVAIASAKKTADKNNDDNTIAAAVAETGNTTGKMSATPNKTTKKTASGKGSTAKSTPVDMSSLALGSSAAGSANNAAAKLTASNSHSAKNTSTSKNVAVNGKIKSTQPLAGAAGSKSITGKKTRKAAANNKTGIAQNKKTSAASNKNDKVIAGNTATRSATPSANTQAGNDNDDLKNTSAVNLKKDKKVIAKLELHQHLIKNNSGSGSSERRYQLDTISIGTFTQEVAENNNTAKANRKIIPGANMHTSPDQEDIMPAAALAAADKTTVAEVKKITAKQKSGVSVIENLQAKFNDIKYNIASVKFAPGITGGINGTFFGPNSFKGFQFGFSGNFIFNDKWSLAAEFKYVHRANNNYSMTDNYSTYTYNQKAQSYEKDSFSHPYSFSTLHSFELPITLSYSKKSFTFFAGGNLVYTLGVNPSEDPLLAPIPATYVTTPGNSGTPKFTSGDLENTRFGIGYLFGFGYRVSPNILFDLRNVQTIWDNSQGAGAHFVSSQLYKSPSLQLSMTYRFGGNKDKE